jgi:hypothetical protein
MKLSIGELWERRLANHNKRMADRERISNAPPRPKSEKKEARHARIRAARLAQENANLRKGDRSGSDI